MGPATCLLYCVCVERMAHWKHRAYNVSLILHVCVETLMYWKHGAYNVSLILLGVETMVH